ncbi:MAG TPA: N-acetyl-gamma-glutamyl-phosphate reductase [Chitinophagaceae bacterium]|nr:N-acetyl-gamma-glutamyl-phosphate reductase [Chitinophagaceae bacterium]
MMRKEGKNKTGSTSQTSAKVASPVGGSWKGAVKVGIIGGAGYTGGELIRLLIHHPDVSVSFIHSRSNAGKPVHSVHQDLLGDMDLQFSAELNNDIDVLFLCLGHGESKKILNENKISDKVKIIDLANDFRLSNDASYQFPGTGTQKPATRNFVYGLPELNRDKIKKANNVANPGCFATTIQLGLLPLAKAGLLKEVYTTGITGSTGAGQTFTSTSHFSWRENNIQAYKTLTHQHLGEIHESLHQLQESFPVSPSHGEAEGLNFVPWRGDFTRGIFVSSQVRCDESLIELSKLYEDFYTGHPFTHVTKEPVFLKQVVNTNKCIIQLEKVGSMLVVHSVTDNLLKGASGQAVQNMNLMFGLDEASGLNLKPSGF